MIILFILLFCINTLFAEIDNQNSFYDMYPYMKNQPNNVRRVVSRSSVNRVRSGNNVIVNKYNTRSVVSRSTQNKQKEFQNVPQKSIQECMASYTSCMNSYCERKNTEYNKCFCSVKLSQIEHEYQPAIENIVAEIIHLKNMKELELSNNGQKLEDFNEYWNKNIGKYTKTNVWQNLEEALKINWVGAENRLQGQQAYKLGNEYCIKTLNACWYASYDMTNSYLSNIGRDCMNYENKLKKIKSIAESIIQNYK